MDDAYIYDPDLAPADHFNEVISRLRCSPDPPNALVRPLSFTCGSFDKYPHSRIPPVSVHSPETKPRDSGGGSTWGAGEETDDHAIAFRHSGWSRARGLVLQALFDLDTPARALHRFQTCGSDPWVVVDVDDNTRLAIHSNHCHSRWCTPCSRERAARIVGNLRITLNETSVLFLTLTMKHSDSPLSAQIDRIYSCFRKLRRAKFWTDGVRGGSAVLELKHSHVTGCWHVHLHCLLDARWVEHKDLKAEWWRITGDSNIVDIRPCGNPDHAAHYVTKYITKPVPASVINKPDQLLEMMAAVAHRRLVLTWGAWRGIRLTEQLDLTTWKAIAPLPQLYRERDAGNLDAYTLLSRLEESLPEARILAGRSPPTPHDDPIGLLF